MQVACTHFLRRRLNLVKAAVDVAEPVEGPVTVHEVCVTADILDAATNEPWMRSSTTTQDPTTRVWITAASSASELEPRERHTTAVTGDLSDSQQHVYELPTLPKESNICPSEKHLVALEVHRRRHQPTFLVWWGQKALGSWKGSVPLEIDRLAEGRVPIRNAPHFGQGSLVIVVNLSGTRSMTQWFFSASNMYCHPLAGFL